MKIINQSHEILSLPTSLLQTIELAGRTCYKSENRIGCLEETCTKPQYNYGWDEDTDRIGCAATCPHHSSHKFAKMLLEHNHHAMIEFGDIIVRFITNRGVTHELVRHRLCSFAQESTRYVRYDGQMEFIKPVWINSDNILGEWTVDSESSYFKTVADEEWFNAMITVEMFYQDLLAAGWRPEHAREVLPNSLKTEIVVKANIREWHHILQLRTSKKAHPQMRALILPLLTDLQAAIPVVFDDINKEA